MNDSPRDGTAPAKAGSVLLLCFALNLLGRGFSDSFATFLIALAREFAWSRAQLTGAYSVSLLVFAGSAPFAGAVLDRYGHRALYLTGLACLTASLFLASVATQLWHLYAAIGLLGGTALASLGMIPAATLLRRWYARRLSTAIAVAWAGLGSGALLIAPAAQHLIETAGWRAAYRTFGTGVALAGVVVLLLPWARILHGPFPVPHASPTAARVRADLAAAVARPVFWGLSAVFMFTSMGMYMVLIEIVAYLTSTGMPTMQAASSFGMLGALSVLGMVGSGWLAGRIGFRATGLVTFAMTLAGVGLLASLSHVGSPLILIAFVVLFGISQGTRGPIIATLATRLFAGPAGGSVYGIVTAMGGLGGAMGSWLSGVLYDATGSYEPSFVVSGACLLLAAAPVLTLREFRTR